MLTLAIFNFCRIEVRLLGCKLPTLCSEQVPLPKGFERERERETETERERERERNREKGKKRVSRDTSQVGISKEEHGIVLKVIRKNVNGCYSTLRNIVYTHFITDAASIYLTLQQS